MEDIYFLEPDELVSAILDMWKADGEDAAARGGELHRYIELHYNREAAEAAGIADSTVGLAKPAGEPGGREYKLFHEFAKRTAQQGYEPFRTEWRLWDKESKVTGTVDMVFTKTEPVICFLFLPSL